MVLNHSQMIIRGEQKKIATFDHLGFGNYDGYEESYKEAAKTDSYLFGDYDAYQAYKEDS